MNATAVGTALDADDVLKVAEVAKLWRVSEETIRALCRVGKLLHHRPSPRSIRIRRGDAKAFFDRS